MNLNDIKNNFLSEHKPKLVILACLVVAFVSGYGAGTNDMNKFKTSRRQINYTTTKGNKPSPTTNTKTTSTNTATTSSEPTLPDDCPIKGNIGSGKKTYHIRGGAFYDRTNPEMCFNTESEAVAAGFIKSSR